MDERRLAEWAERSVRMVAEQSGVVAKSLMSKLAGLVPDIGQATSSRHIAPKPAAPRKRAPAKKRPATKQAAPAKRTRRTKPKA